jgi:phosphatidate cytidylyltransferase
MLLGLVLSLLCYREYARATGLFREHLLSAVVVAGIILVHFAALDNYYRLFVAAWPISISFIVLVPLIADRPSGYIQRLALAVLGFMLFGMWMGHFAFFANNPNYRAILLWLLLCVELNDVFAYLSGRLFGKRKLCPNTSPNKTRAGAIGAALISIPLTASLGHLVFRSEPIDALGPLLALGIVISLAALVGDLMLSSIKRDLGIKDLAATLPGHGGLLDRFDSLLLALPASFHLINYIQGINTGLAANIITGSFGNS